MSNKLKERLLGKTAGLAEKVAATSRPSISEQRPVTMPGQLGAFRLEALKYVERIDELTAQLEEARRGGGAIDVPLQDLVEVPGRRRKLTVEQFGELKQNLAHNPLVTPITVRRYADGGFEIVSGHNRVEAYRQLGRDSIRAVLDDSSDEQADLNAFYANLLQPDLSDFEKYLGFRMIQTKYPKLTQAAIAEQAGLAENLVSMLMSFQHLPKEVLVLLEDRPEILGANAASALAGLTREGRRTEVTLAVQRLAAGELDQGQAVKAASAKAVQAGKPVVPLVRIRAGREAYCDLRLAKNVLRLQFKTEEDASEIQSAIQELLERRAAQKKSGKEVK